MSELPGIKPRVAIACGGTGGHLFPGLAVSDELKRRGCDVTLLISTKEVDRVAVRGLPQEELLTLPSAGLSSGRVVNFIRGLRSSYRLTKAHFRAEPPAAALTMGGFTGAGPLLALKGYGARTYLHESNAIPGRANRWLSWRIDRAFVGFPDALSRLHTRRGVVSGTPVRPQLVPRDPAGCRWALGLDPQRPVVLVMGGSQGASGINQRVLRTLPQLVSVAPDLQFVHLTGSAEFEEVKAGYAALGVRAAVHAFFHEMEIVLGGATVAISRAGASSMAELAAMRVPPILIPYPAATDNHQFYNARAFQESGAARLLVQQEAEPEVLGKLLLDIIRNDGTRTAMQRALEPWHKPNAAREIAESILSALNATTRSQGAPSRSSATSGGAIRNPGSSDRVERGSGGIAQSQEGGVAA